MGSVIASAPPYCDVWGCEILFGVVIGFGLGYISAHLNS